MHVTCSKTRVGKNARADVRCVEQARLTRSARSKHGGWVSGARVQETPVKRVEHAVPDGDEHVAVAFHRKRIVQGPQHRTGIEEVGGLVKAMMPDGLNHARRVQGRADAAPADVQGIDREVMVVQPVIAE